MMGEFSGPEKQVLLQLGLLNKSDGTPVDRTTLEKHGSRYFCSFKMHWDNAIATLIERRIIEMNDEFLEVSEPYINAAEKLRARYPRFKYWYNDWYRLAEGSPIHSLFCREVYGIDLCQTGMVTANQVQTLESEIKKPPSPKIIDLGCGTGRILEYLCRATGATGVGIDPIVSGLRFGSARMKRLGIRAQLLNADMRTFLPSAQTADFILANDSLYFVGADIEHVVTNMMATLNPGGRLLLLYSAWKGKDENLDANTNTLGRILTSHRFSFTSTDFSEEDRLHWVKKRDVLTRLEHDFREEENELLWSNRVAEATFFAKLAESGESSRFLYIVAG